MGSGADNLANVCFVIGAIGDRHASPGSDDRLVFDQARQVLTEVIEPACKSHDLQVIRADQIARPGEIPEQIFRLLRDARLVIADLTGGNANVMYELGLRHTTKKLTIQVGERGRLPFDVSVIRTILFVRSPEGLAAARDQLQEAIRVGFTDGADLVSAARVWSEQSELAAKAATRQKSSRRRGGASSNDVGILDALAQLNEGKRPDDLLHKLTALSRELVPLLSDAEIILIQATDYGQQDDSLRRWAAQLDGIARAIETVSANFGTIVLALKMPLRYGLITAKQLTRDAGAQRLKREFAKCLTVLDETIDRVEKYLAEPFNGNEADQSFKEANATIVKSLQSFLANGADICRSKALAGGA